MSISDAPPTPSVTGPVAEGADIGRCPRILYVDPLAGPLSAWGPVLDRARGLGFSHVALPPPLAGRDIRLLDDPEAGHPSLGGDARAVLDGIDAACRAAGLSWLLDVRLDAVAPGGVAARTGPFASPDRLAPLDPDGEPPVARWTGDEAALVAFWSGLLGDWRGAGAAGFRLSGLAALPPAVVQAINATHRRAHGASLVVGALDGVADSGLPAWSKAGLDRMELAVDHWDDEAEYLIARAGAATVALLLAVERPYGRRFAATPRSREAWRVAARRLVAVAASLGDGWLMPMGFAEASTLRMDARHGIAAPGGAPDEDVSAAVRAANGPMPPMGPPAPLPAAEPWRGFVRKRGEALRVTVVNHGRSTAKLDVARLVPGFVGETAPVAAGDAASFELRPAAMLRIGRHPRERTAAERARSGRIGIEAVTPTVDGGRFAAKRIAGETVTAEADIVCDGHDKLAVVVQWRPLSEQAWSEARMVPVGNDRWRASFVLAGMGRVLFRVAAWRDAFATFRDELAKKIAAGIDVHLETQEGRALVGQTLPDVDASGLDAQGLLDEALAARMQAADPRRFLSETTHFPIDAEQPRAGFSAWYEIFPRSMAGDGVRHGTFRDVVKQLPRIRDMGFDVLYFPPIHPIGRTNRKGRNNSLTPGPDDPGSPYAIGSTEGGHDAIHPELGTLEDFRNLVLQAQKHGLALALDFAIQCAPDHPWLKEHRDWFSWRPDGSMRYAENPPKKYEDIVNVDFYAPGAVPGLWTALADAVFFWLKQGIRIFRVDNPHTKPFPFWEWLILEVRSAYPDAIFLAEAFTRPKVMNRLGKVGFAQSYTYFTWRNTKAELQEYMTQLETGPEREFFRPNFFVNTPDINPPFLQTGGRPAHLIRAVLAATLAGNWGVYSGFDLCEATPLPGREEYLDSEKYQLRAWDWDRPGNIVAEISELNRIRRRHPALWSHLGASFLPASDDQVIFYERATPDRSDVLLIAVSLDPRSARSAAIELPLWKWGLPDEATIACRDLLHDSAFPLTGKWQRVALSPEAPYTIWHARPRG